MSENVVSEIGLRSTESERILLILAYAIFRACSENKGRSEAYFQSSSVISATFIFGFLRKYLLCRLNNVEK